MNETKDNIKNIKLESGEVKTNNALKDDTKADQASDNEDKKIKRQLKINYVCICFYAFLTGSDFAVIIPTLWDRLHIDFNASGSFLGLVMSAYSISGVLFGLILGKVSDVRPELSKIFYLICIFSCAFGHLLYFIGLSKYLILFARTISGLCLGATTVALAYIAKTSSVKSRTSLISLVMASRQLGLMVGPAFNIFLRKINFKIFNTFVVDRKSSPGIFMASVWSIIFFVFLFLFKELSKKENKNLEEKVELIDQNVSVEQNSCTQKQQIKHFMRIEILVLLLTTFFTYFNQTSLETVLIPFTEDTFKWNELHNSILFCFGGVVIIASYVLIRFLTKKFADRIVLLYGVFLILLGLATALICLTFLNTKTQLNINYDIPLNSSNDTNETTTSYIVSTEIYLGFGFSFLLDVLGLPAIAICSASLFTKLVDNKLQGLGQGIQRGVLGIGTILGPLCAGPFIKQPIIVLGSCFFMIFLILIFVLISFSKLLPK